MIQPMMKLEELIADFQFNKIKDKVIFYFLFKKKIKKNKNSWILKYTWYYNFYFHFLGIAIFMRSLKT